MKSLFRGLRIAIFSSSALYIHLPGFTRRTGVSAPLPADNCWSESTNKRDASMVTSVSTSNAAADTNGDGVVSAEEEAAYEKTVASALSSLTGASASGTTASSSSDATAGTSSTSSTSSTGKSQHDQMRELAHALHLLKA